MRACGYLSQALLFQFGVDEAELLDQVVQLLNGINMDDQDTKGDLAYGFSLDDKRAPLVKEGETPTHEQNNILDVIECFHTLHDPQSDEYSRSRTDQSFVVPVAEIIAKDYDLSINRYKEVVYAEVRYDTPGDILKRIKALHDKMADGIADLEKLL